VDYEEANDDELVSVPELRGSLSEGEVAELLLRVVGHKGSEWFGYVVRIAVGEQDTRLEFLTIWPPTLEMTGRPHRTLLIDAERVLEISVLPGCIHVGDLLEAVPQEVADVASLYTSCKLFPRIPSTDVRCDQVAHLNGESLQGATDDGWRVCLGGTPPRLYRAERTQGQQTCAVISWQSVDDMDVPMSGYWVLDNAEEVVRFDLRGLRVQPTESAGYFEPIPFPRTILSAVSSTGGGQ